MQWRAWSPQSAFMPANALRSRAEGGPPIQGRAFKSVWTTCIQAAPLRGLERAHLAQRVLLAGRCGDVGERLQLVEDAPLDEVGDAEGLGGVLRDLERTEHLRHTTQAARTSRVSLAFQQQHTHHG